MARKKQEGPPYKTDECNDCGNAKKPGQEFYVSPEKLASVLENGQAVAHEKGVCVDCYRARFKEVYPGVQCRV